MAKNEKIESTIENWESGLLGNDEAFAKLASDITANDADDMLALQLISIRLQKSMIKDLKFIAEVNGLGGYQPLIRRVLDRFVEAEMKSIARELMANEISKSKKQSIEDSIDSDKLAACG